MNLDVTRVYSPRKRVFPSRRTVRGSEAVVLRSLVAAHRGLGTIYSRGDVRLCRDPGIVVIRREYEGIWRSRRGTSCIVFAIARS